MRKPFDNIKLSHLYTLCITLADTRVRHVSNIRRKYLENALSFDETLSLLVDLKIVKNNSDELYLIKSFSLIHDSIDDFKNKFLPILFSANDEVSEHLRDFLLNFQVDIDKTFFKATDLQKIKFSDIRNLLLELDFIKVSDDNSTYIINPQYTSLFINHFLRKILSPKTLKQRQLENDSIGLAAEKAIIEFEVRRLKDISIKPKEIEHTSQYNVLAGYDIKSFENYLDSNAKLIDRYIEVKAVSALDYKFYWSRNELEISRIFGEKYFLYLLPVISENTFDFEKLMIIKNPFKTIYSNEIEWNKMEESICLTKKN
jgi:hypothetical protein